MCLEVKKHKITKTLSLYLCTSDSQLCLGLFCPSEGEAQDGGGHGEGGGGGYGLGWIGGDTTVEFAIMQV